jgi:hypothetical protein
MPLFPVSDQNHIWLDSSVGGKHRWAIAGPFAGLDSFGGGCTGGSLAILHFDISVDISGLQVPDNKSNGGEGGILLPPLPANADDSYTSGIVPCV